MVNRDIYETDNTTTSNRLASTPTDTSHTESYCIINTYEKSRDEVWYETELYLEEIRKIKASWNKYYKNIKPLLLRNTIQLRNTPLMGMGWAN